MNGRFSYQRRPVLVECRRDFMSRESTSQTAGVIAGAIRAKNEKRTLSVYRDSGKGLVGRLLGKTNVACDIWLRRGVNKLYCTTIFKRAAR